MNPTNISLQAPLRDPEPSEFIAESLSVHDQNCIGCQTHRRHVMVSFTRKGDPAVYDLFLTEHQTTRLAAKLREQVVNQ